MANYPPSLYALASKRLQVLRADHEVSWDVMSYSYTAADLEREVKYQLCQKIARHIAENIPIRVTDEHHSRLYTAQAVVANRPDIMEVLYEAYRLGFSDAADHHLTPTTKVPDGP